MNVREKLVELLEPHVSGLACEYESGSCELTSCRSCNARNIADYLIANGITVQEWISVNDRLPEEGEYVLCVLKGFNYAGKIQVCKFVPADKFKDKPYFEHFRNGFPSVTHWMPLPSTEGLK